MPPRSSLVPACSSALTTEYRHTPVLLAEVLKHLSPNPGSIIVDCTLGGAGHSDRIAALIAPAGTLVGIDQDDAALIAAAATLRLGQQTFLLKGNFGDLDRLLAEANIPYADGFLFDLGVSSPQLDVVERGFSYHGDAPLDMRMDPAAGGITAADVVNSYQESDLARVIREYGEERWATRIAAFIVAARARRPVTSTSELVDIIKAAVPAAARKDGPHPARRTFQALRIEVNSELEVLETALRAAVRWLVPGGRLVVISYHSLEDRVVKRAFQELSAGCTCPPDLPVCVCDTKPVLRVLTRKAVVPSPDEIERNTRSRSAKLRAAEKL
jgi:16S rRNA (cytosine1402-N4)-methyltransferase